MPPEILRYVIARTKIKKHIDFDTGPSLFETADEYERLVSNPPKNGDLNKKKEGCQRYSIRCFKIESSN